jgi:RimJ/RimL family protein N-acetyltransferase
MVPTLETERLTLRRITIEDTSAIQELFPQWEIVKYLNARVPWPYPADGALVFVRDILLPAMEKGEQWAWGIYLKGGPPHLIGVINLSKARDENRGFWLGLKWQGQGLMTEACRAVTEFWFNTLNFERLRVAKAIANTASRRISGREGARLAAVEDRDYVCGSGPTEIWELTREDWNRLNGQSESGQKDASREHIGLRSEASGYSRNE